MNPHSLLASASINIGLAFIILSLFSILKKQPSNASIYYARPLSHRQYIPFDSPSTPRRFLPTISWISRAFRVTEDEIIEAYGLDALVIIRFFKFGIKLFSVCSLIGLVVLLPINYGGQEAHGSYYSLDSFTISNVSRGSNRFWVHFACLCFISFYGMFLLYKEYDEILIRRIQQLQNVKHRPDQFTIVVREIPLCIEHKARDCCVDHFFSKHYPNTYYSYQMVYDTGDLEELANQTKSIARRIEDLRKTSMAKKHRHKLSLLDALQQKTSEVDLLEEKLQALCQKIHQLQCKDMLKKKHGPNRVH